MFQDQHDAVTSAISTTSMHATTLVASSVPTASVSAGINAITTSAASESESTPLAVGVTAAVGIPVKTKVSDRAKKKAWYSVLYPSYKSRSEDFKKLFKGVPDDERLVVGEWNSLHTFVENFATRKWCDMLRARPSCE